MNARWLWSLDFFRSKVRTRLDFLTNASFSPNSRIAQSAAFMRAVALYYANVFDGAYCNFLQFTRATKSLGAEKMKSFTEKCRSGLIRLFSIPMAAAFMPGLLLPVSGPFICTASAQQILVSTPFTNVSDSFYERNGVNFGFSLPGGTGNGSRIVGYGPGGITPNIGFNQGSFGATIPPVGGYSPNSSARFGFGRIGNGGGGFSLGFELGKGSSRSISSTTPSLMVQNGGYGSLFHGTVSPFVTGVIPVIGSSGLQPGQIDNAVTRAINSGLLDSSVQPLYSRERERTREERRQRIRAASGPAPSISSAQNSDLSVEAIRANRERELDAMNAAIMAIVDEAIAFEAEGDFYHARRRYSDAIIACKDRDLKKQLKEMMRRVGKTVESDG